MNRLFFFLFLFASAASSFGQNTAIGQWRSHMPYIDGVHVTEVGNKIYCATLTGLFYWDKSDNSVHPLSKTDGFTDVFVKTMAYDKKHDILFIAYQNGGFDELHAGRITYHSTFKDNNVIINSIYINGDTAYMACSPGSNVGLAYWQILEDQLNTPPFNCFGTNGAYRATNLGQYTYVCSDSGVRRSVYNRFLIADCGLWQAVSTDSCSNLVTFAGRVFGSFKDGYLRYYDTLANKWVVVHHNTYNRHIQSLEADNGKLVMATNDSIYQFDASLHLFSFPSSQQNDVIVDNDGTLWIAKNTYALLSVNSSGTGYHQPPGRPSTTSGNISYGYHNEIWVTAGQFKNDGSPSFNNSGFYMYDGETWHNFNSQTLPGHPDIRDYMGMAKDSITNHLWLASVDTGLVEFDPATQTIVKVYYSVNTGKILPTAFNDRYGHTPVADVAFDKDGNLWAGMYRTNPDKNLQLAERKRDGSFAVFTKGTQAQVNKILVDDFGYIWMVDSRESNGVVIYNHHDNKIAVLTATQGDGNLPSTNVNCIAKDKSGQVWMGTSAGVCVYSDPSLLFGTRKYDVQRPYISNGVNSGYLLAAQSVNFIAIDGANRKWFATNDGAYLFNPDGDKELFHFNTANSPLVSNQINSISINGETGEVFFVTDKGILSYRGTATDGGQHMGDVYAFPNPVKPGYNGPIAIKGLVNDANVKITDITGTLVYETIALGGQAIWYGKNFSGQPANSGVYLVFITNTDGTETKVAKIMIVR